MKIYVDEKHQYHRDNGPALEYETGGKFWYQHGKLHRENGPAVELNNRKEWWKNGKKYNPTEHEVKLYESGNS